MLSHMFQVDIAMEKKIASFALLTVYAKLFYWMRVFDSTAAFIRMLTEIVKDCIPFMVFLVICIGMFATPLLVLDQARYANGLSDSPINEEVFGTPFFDSIIRSYLVGLGEFGMDNFSE
jgi:hypothetical protein